MADNPYTPFPDVDVPRRDDEQKRLDRERNQEQLALLIDGVMDERTGKRGSSTGPGRDELDDTLFERRSEAGPDVVRIDVVPTDAGRDHWAMVAPNRLVLRNTDPGLSPDAERILDEASFQVTPRFADDGTCEELLSRVTEYTGPADAGIEVVRDIAQRLQGAGVTATPAVVKALQIVIKAAVGPAPTTVADDPSFREAGLHKPEGGVVVAVIDTGIADVERRDGRLNEVARTAGRVDPLDVFPPPGNCYLDFAAGHGTFAAGIVRMIDPEAEIRVYAALDSDGFAHEIDVACAMIRAVKDGAHVLNLSLGMHTVDDGPSVPLQVALEVIDEIAEEQGRPSPAIVAAAGNYGDDEPVWPAASERVVAVAGLTPDFAPSRFSSFGDWVDCCCVAEGVVSTFVPGDEDPAFSVHHPEYPPPDHYPLDDKGDSWAVWSGTSFAAPQVAGAISRICREKGLPPRDAAERLLDDASPLAGNPGFGRALHLLSGT